MTQLLDRLQQEIDMLSAHRGSGPYQATRDMKIAVLKDFRDKLRSEAMVRYEDEDKQSSKT